MGKRIFQEMAVGGLSGLVLVLVYILIRAYLDGAEPGDWLQFVGAMLGSGTAVGGALFIEGRKRRQDEQRGQATLLDALNETAYAIRSVGEPLDGDLSQKVGLINARRYLLEAAKEFTDFVLKQHLLPSSQVGDVREGWANILIGFWPLNGSSMIIKLERICVTSSQSRTGIRPYLKFRSLSFPSLKVKSRR